MSKKRINEWSEVIIDGEHCVEFITNGKYRAKVLVDKTAWENYLIQYHWTANLTSKYPKIKTSINNRSISLTRVIVENEFSEIDYWGNVVDHINNEPLDNRKSNLRLVNSKLNTSNIKSKYRKDDMHLIFAQSHTVNGIRRIRGYKVHTNIFDEPIYENFRTIEESKLFRDSVVVPYFQKKYLEMLKKTRDVEFERGLKNKLENNEQNEINEILVKYSVI